MIVTHLVVLVCVVSLRIFRLVFGYRAYETILAEDWDVRLECPLPAVGAVGLHPKQAEAIAFARQADPSSAFTLMPCSLTHSLLAAVRPLPSILPISL